MSLSEYFESTKGTGVLATADLEGRVDAAIYARPHFFDNGSCAFIMRDRLTHHNLKSNPHATFLFIESGGGYRGKRLFLTKTHEEENSDRIPVLKRRSSLSGSDTATPLRFLVYFKIVKELPLIGS
jgi:hypothetical protein